MRKIIPSLILLTILAGSIGAGAQNICSCWQPADTNAGWHVVPFAWDSDGNYAPSPPLYQNDDGSTGPILLPFKFCFWGTMEDTVYINNNGTVSFGQAYSTYSPLIFPSLNYSMVAPFWADVDTRNPISGVVYYKLTPTYLIVQWDTVGYFNMNAGPDSNDSFQLIITNGTDPIVPDGNNVEFCYGKMQWTTGDASGGMNGFGGNPATAGINKGDGVNFLQLGWFDSPNSNYFGQFPPGPNYNGVYWLSNKTFAFNVCTANNVLPPFVSGISPCDTVKLCANDTARLDIYFYSPDSNNLSNAGLLPPAVPGVSVLNNYPGAIDSILIQIVGSPANFGTHIVHLAGWVTNLNPSDTSFVNFVLEVDSGAKGRIVASSDTICKGSSVTIKMDSCNATAYLWSNGATTDSIVVSPLVTTTYSVQLTSGTCVSDRQMTIVVLNNITGGFTSAPNPQCIGQPVNFTNNTVGANRYHWNFGDTASGPADSSNLQNPVHIFNSPGTYTVELIATNTGGSCSPDTAKVIDTIITKPQPIITGTDSVCPLAKNGVLNASNGFTSYKWAPGGESSQNVTGLSAGTYTVTVTLATCTGDTTFTIHTKPNPTPVAGASPDTLCKGDSTVLAGGGGGTYLWNPGMQTSSSVTVKPVNTTTYTLTVTTNGCTDSTRITVFMNKTPIVTNAQPVNLCPGGSVQLAVNTMYGATYLWLPNTNLSSDTVPNPFANPSVNTTYTVLVSNGPCKAIGYATVNVLTGAAGIAGNDTTIGSKGTARLFVKSAQGGQSYKWIPSGGVACDTCPNTTANPATTQKYYLQITDSNGCTLLDSVLVTVLDTCATVFVPNAFSPNGNGHNELECLYGGCIQSLDFAIFDRWGNKVFETNDPTKCWDGTYNGVLMNTGEFVYYLNATLNNGKTINQKGNITLIR